MLPPAAECSEKGELLEALRSAIAAIIDLNNRQWEAAMAGQIVELQSMDAELRREQIRKGHLIYAYMNHVREHGC